MQFPAAGYMNNNARTEGEMKQAFEDLLAAAKQLPGGAAVSTLAIAAGVVTPTGSVHLIDTESAASTDDLATMATTNLPDGSLLLIASVADGRDVVLKHLAGGTGQMNLAHGADFTLDVAKQGVLFQLRAGVWVEVMRQETRGYKPGAVTLLTAGTTFTPAKGVRALRVKLKAAGGGGGGAQAVADVSGERAQAGGGGGAEGGEVEVLIATVAASYTYAIGAGGAAGSSAGGDGGNGGDTTFGAFTAKGGGGGQGSGSVSVGAQGETQRYRLGKGGVGQATVANAGAHRNLRGSNGFAGSLSRWMNNAGGVGDHEVVGGAGAGFGAGVATDPDANGVSADANTGAGGAGASADSINVVGTVSQSGGAGGSGYIVVEELY